MCSEVCSEVYSQVSTVAHDSIMTPCDVIKQRMQNGEHASTMEAIRHSLKTEQRSPTSRWGRQATVELQALVASLTTPPEDFSDKLSSEFDSLFGDMDMFGHGEQDLQVKAMGDTDAGIDEATMAAARRVM